MAVLQVEELGVEYYYEDTGHRENVSYTTVFAVHGVSFSLHTFSRARAAASRASDDQYIRLVTIARRGYPGSSPYTEKEGALLAGSQQDREAYLAARGNEMAHFMLTFVQKNSIQPPSKDSKRGGIALLGWSFGALFALAPFGQANALSEKVQSALAPYLRHLILFDPAQIGLGWPSPSYEEASGRYYNPTKTNLPPDELAAAVTRWIGTYYNHGNEGLDNMDFRPHGDKNSLETMNEEEQKQNFGPSDAVFGPGGDLHIMTPVMAVQLKQQVEDALFYKQGKGVLPQVPATLVVCCRSAWSFVYASRQIYALKQERRGRALNLIDLPESNHFVVWDDPELFLDALQRIVT